MGKSTLINRLVPDANLRTAEISDAHNTGQHTTTFSEMISLPDGGWLIDTPGIKGFGTFDMEPEELTSYFPEIFRFSKDCRFSASPTAPIPTSLDVLCCRPLKTTLSLRAVTSLTSR